MPLAWSAFVLASSALLGLGFQEYLARRQKQRDELYASATAAQLWALRLLGWTTSALLVWLHINRQEPDASAVKTSLSVSGLVWDVWSLVSLGWCTLQPKPDLLSSMLSPRPVLWVFNVLASITSEGFVKRYWLLVVPVSAALTMSSMAIVAQSLMKAVPSLSNLPGFARRHVNEMLPVICAAISRSSLALGCLGSIFGLVALEVVRRGITYRITRPLVMVIVALLFASVLTNQGIGLSTVVLAVILYALAVEGKVLPKLAFAFIQTIGVMLPFISVAIAPWTLPATSAIGVVFSAAPTRFALMAEGFTLYLLTLLFATAMTWFFQKLLKPLFKEWIPNSCRAMKEKSRTWIVDPGMRMLRWMKDFIILPAIDFAKPKLKIMAKTIGHACEYIGSSVLRCMKVVGNVLITIWNTAMSVFRLVLSAVGRILNALISVVKWAYNKLTSAAIKARTRGLNVLRRIKDASLQYIVNPLKERMVPIKDAIVEGVTHRIINPVKSLVSKILSYVARRKSLFLGICLCYFATYQMYEDLTSWRVLVTLCANAGLAVALHTLHSTYDFPRTRSQTELAIPPWEGVQNISLVFLFYIGRVGYSAFKAYGLSPKPEDVQCNGDIGYICLTAAVSGVLFCFHQILREALNDTNPYPELAHYREYLKSCSLGLALVRAIAQLVPLLASHRLFLLFLLVPSENRCSSLYFALRFVLVSLISVPSGLLIFIPWLLMPLRSDQPLEGVWGYAQPLFNRLLGRNWNDFNAVVGLSCCAVGFASLFSFHPLNVFVCAGACSHGLYLLCLHFPWSRPLQQFSHLVRRSFQYSQPIIALVASFNFAHAAVMTCSSRESILWAFHAIGFGIAAIETFSVAMMLFGNISFHSRIGARGRVLFDFVLHFRRAAYRTTVRTWNVLRKYRHNIVACWEALIESVRNLMLPMLQLVRAGFGIIWRNAILSWISSLGLLVMLYKCYQWGLDEAIINLANGIVEKAYSLVPSALTLTLSSLKTVGIGAAEVSKSVVLEVAVNWVHELESGHLLHSSTFAWWANFVFHTCALFRLQYRAEVQSVPLIFVPLIAASVAWALGKGTVLVAIVVSGHWVLILSHWSNFARSLQNAYMTSNRGSSIQERVSHDHLAVELARRFAEERNGVASYDMDDCIICVEPLQPDSDDEHDNSQPSSSAAEVAVSVLPCGHPFHRGCIAEWLKTKMQCPICRRAVPVA